MKITQDDFREPAERVHTRLAARESREEKHRRRRKRTLVIAAVLLCAGVTALVLWAVMRPASPKAVTRGGGKAESTAAKAKAEKSEPASTAPAAAQSAAAAQPTPTAQPAPEPSQPAAAQPQPAALVAPLEGQPLYPLTATASMGCGQWSAGSQDYPYFGAPRDGGSRNHAGVDVYPAAGAGAPVRAIKDGTVVKVAVFYTRATGEQTYGILVDHGDFVANYAELHPAGISPGGHVAKGQVIGTVSGTLQLHFEEYAPGTTNWISWYGAQPANLIDPTGLLQSLGL